MSIATSLASVIRNNHSEYTARIAEALHNNDAWNGETPTRIIDMMNARRRRNLYRGMNHIRTINVEYFTPYLSHFPEQYRRIDDVIAQLPRIIVRIKELKEIERLEAQKVAIDARINQLNQDAAMIKTIAAKPIRYSKDDIETIKDNKNRNEKHWLKSDLLSEYLRPPAPAAPIDPKDIAEVSIEGAQFKKHSSPSLRKSFEMDIIGDLD
jgi:hypothetical protein